MKNKIQILLISSLLLSLIGMTIQMTKWRKMCETVTEMFFESQAQSIKSHELARKAFAQTEEWKTIVRAREANTVRLGTNGGSMTEGDMVEVSDVWIDGDVVGSMTNRTPSFIPGSQPSTISGLCVIRDANQTNQYWFSKPTAWTNLWDWTNGLWIPKVGDRIQTSYLPGPPTIHTVTNVIKVGEVHSQTGWMVYCDGLPGLDAWWVKPAP